MNRLRIPRCKTGQTDPQLAFGLLLYLSVMLPWPADAAVCSITSGGPTNLTISPPILTVSRDAAPGSVLYQSGNVQTPTTTISCSGSMSMLAQYTNPLSTTGSASVYQTNVPGVGIKIVANYNGTWPIGNPPTYWGDTVNNYSGPAYFPFSLSIVVTGPVSPGTFTLANPVVSNYASASSTSLVNSVLLHTVTVSAFTVTARSCATPNVTVNLGNHPWSEFSGVGSTSSSTSFSIGLNGCPSGLNAVKYQIDPVTAIVPGTGNTVVTLNGDSTASRVGVQLLDGNGTPLPLSSPLTFSGYSSGTGGNYTIPLKARYYQIATPVGPGAANAAMIFTMTYQ